MPDFEDRSFRTSSGKHAPFSGTAVSIGMRQVLVRATAMVDGIEDSYEEELQARKPVSDEQMALAAKRHVRDWLNGKY